MSKKSQVVRVRSPRLFEHHFLKAVGKTEIGGSCKVYAGKTSIGKQIESRTLASKK